MFLDDNLLMVGREVNIKSKRQILKGCKRIIKICFINIVEKSGNNPDLKTLLANIKRVNNTYKSVAIQLQKEGRGILKENGFKRYIENDKHLNKFAKFL